MIAPAHPDTGIERRGQCRVPGMRIPTPGHAAAVGTVDRTAGLSVALAVTCGLVAWLSSRAEQARREPAECAAREFRVAEMHPDQPLAMFHLVVKGLHENDPALVCFIVTLDGERAFAEAADTTTCASAINALHGADRRQGLRQCHFRS